MIKINRLHGYSVAYKASSAYMFWNCMASLT